MQIPLLGDIVILFGLAVFVLFICHRFRVPAIVGFLLTGIVAGPHGMGLIKAVHEVEVLAEVGVILLLFTIGIEFSLQKLLQIKRSVLMGGSLQVFLTLLFTLFIVHGIGLPMNQSVFIGFLASLSSTAIVLKLFQERAEVDTPQGRNSLAILIFQDIIIVPMMLLTPLLAGATGNVTLSLLVLLAKGIVVILLVFVSAKWIVPQILHQIARTRSRELFLLSIVVMCLAVAWLTSSVGLSLALGAFLAGLIISESEYSHQAFSSILPFRDVFTSFFFVSIGMLFDVHFLLEQPGLILFITLIILFSKAIIADLATILMGYPLRTAIMVGMALGQIGEFSFILSKTGVDHGLLTGNSYQLFLAVSVLTMASTPFLMAMAPGTADFILKLPIPSRLRFGLYPMPGIKDDPGEKQLTDHLIIIGFGVGGRNVSQAANTTGVPYVILEMNPDTVRNERKKGERIYYGDATQEAVLEHAGVENARVIVITIPDAVGARRITAVARTLNPGIYIIARTRYLQEVKPLQELGADEVIPEEFETSVEIFARVLARYLVPRDEIEQFITQIRADGYCMFRSISRDATSFTPLQQHFPGVEISTFRVARGSFIAGKTLGEVGLRKKYSVTLLAVHRDSYIISDPGAETRLLADDVAILLGTPEKIIGAKSLFRTQDEKGAFHESDLPQCYLHDPSAQTDMPQVQAGSGRSAGQKE